MRLAIVLLLCLCSSGEAFAWGQEGHSIIAEIAQRRLTRESSAKVEELLKGGSLAPVASWADDFRAGPDGKKTSNWHFANIPLEAEFPWKQITTTTATALWTRPTATVLSLSLSD